MPPRFETAELLAPAGNWECVRAAVANGADAVYFGLPRFNARLRADNFSDEELTELVTFCHRHGVKAYVAFNTLVFTAELEAAAEQLRICNRAGVDALIVQDVGLVRLAAAITPELPIHASTQMTITSPEGVEFARELGIRRAVLARELSLRELAKFRTESEATLPLPLEVFVHGALCVAYSGQCLTSESLGQRSANRGECAQACRMPYELLVDGAVKDLGDRRYLLSPQDLAAVNELPHLLELGVTSFKIEGRLKSPEYVAAVCQVYRKALDAAVEQREANLTPADRYQLEMTFSRGLYSGWMHGVNHQELVPARSGKKRGPFAGRVERIGRDFVELRSATELKPGDGVVFDTGGDTNAEQGGRIYQVKGGRLFFQHGLIDFGRIKPGDRVWKTDDPALEKRLQQSFSGRIEPRRRVAVDLRVSGGTGEPLVVEARIRGASSAEDGASGAVFPAGRVEPQAAGLCSPKPDAAVRSALPLQTARTAPLGTEKLREHLGKFGESVYELGELQNALVGEVILPISELNRLRRELVFALDAARKESRPESQRTWRDVFAGEMLSAHASGETAELTVLCRSMEQIEAALDCEVQTLYVDFEDIRRGKEAVALVRQRGTGAAIFLATPRIQKAGEQGFFKVIENAGPDGVLIRNLGAIDYFCSRPQLRAIGDFSLNVANPLTAQYFTQCKQLERVTISYDLNIEQVLDLLGAAPAKWFELTLHQHMPMFHMEHCVFAAFMSEGTDHTNCGRPCEKHRVHLRDRVGMEHPLRADVGCRNTLFNAVPQTGARFFRSLEAAGLRHYRAELLEEDATATRATLQAYQALLSARDEGENLWRTLRAQSQLGVTRGTLDAR
jgi:putative protease